MKRTVIKIDEEKCNGCGICAEACAEGAIAIIDGKAKLIKDEYCDGLGACIGECPEGAIEFIEREAAPFNEEETEKHLKEIRGKAECSCPSSQPKGWEATETSQQSTVPDVKTGTSNSQQSALENWPVQLKLVPIAAEYFNNADVLLSADCVPFADANFHESLLKGRKLIIGCPKLDDVDFYVEKLTEILKNNDIKSLTVAHMEVPCCSGLIYTAKRAVQDSGKEIPLKTVEVKIR